MVLGADPRRVDFDQSPAGARGQGPLKSTARFLCSCAANDIGDFRVVGLDQPALTDQGVLDLTRELEPLRRAPESPALKLKT